MRHHSRSLFVVILGLCVELMCHPAAWAERNWEFSVSAFGGKAYHANTDMKIHSGSVAIPYEATVHGVTLNDSGTFGGKLTAWYLPRNYSWQPQIGLELDFTRFTADLHPQLRGADGTIALPNLQVGAVGFNTIRDVSVNTLAANLLFRYPIWSNSDLPQGRLAPYVGIGVGAQRAAKTLQRTGNQEVSYAPAIQLLTGMKFFVMKNLAVFAEYKRIWASHEFTYPADNPATGYKEQWHITTNVLAAGVALHF